MFKIVFLIYVAALPLEDRTPRCGDIPRGRQSREVRRSPASHGYCDYGLLRNGRPDLIIIIWMLVGMMLTTPAFAHDTDPVVSQWMKSLMQPDAPYSPCCGEADAYWADGLHVRNGRTFVTITDDRDDDALHRRHVPIGTEIEIPDWKLKWDAGNPTGHAVVFLGDSRQVFCFVQGTGI